MPTHSRPNAREDYALDSRFDGGGVNQHALGAPMLRSKILSVVLALMPAAILVTGHSTLGEAKGDECKAKPDSSAPAGLHWYYRVDRANNRHCWYLHAQGMPVHSRIDATSRNPDTQSDNGDEQPWKAPPVTRTPQPQYQQSDTTAEQPGADFTARWVDLPKSVDLNAHELVLGSNGYAAERGVQDSEQQLPPVLSKVSAVSEEGQQNAEPQTNFGSISLAGAAVLALLLVSEALVRVARTFGWNLLGRRLRVHSRRRTENVGSADLPHHVTARRGTTPIEPISRTQTEVSELLHRAGAGLKPPRSFAPSRSVHARGQAHGARSHSAFERLKSRTFSGMTWAPL